MFYRNNPAHSFERGHTNWRKLDSALSIVQRTPAAPLRRDENSLRVTNLSDDVTEADLQELFRPFGPVSRVFVAVDRATGENRGFAFVNYVYRCALGYRSKTNRCRLWRIEAILVLIATRNLWNEAYWLHAHPAMLMYPLAHSCPHSIVPCMNANSVCVSPYTCREDAEKAIRALEGFGYDNLILHVEWAAPRADR
eukprot:scaffold208_cov15-Tisochrysis_lutea.AAC.1